MENWLHIKNNATANLFKAEVIHGGGGAVEAGEVCLPGEAGAITDGACARDSSLSRATRNNDVDHQLIVPEPYPSKPFT